MSDEGYKPTDEEIMTQNRVERFKRGEEYMRQLGITDTEKIEAINIDWKVYYALGKEIDWDKKKVTPDVEGWDENLLRSVSEDKKAIIIARIEELSMQYDTDKRVSSLEGAAITERLNGIIDEYKENNKKIDAVFSRVNSQNVDTFDYWTGPRSNEDHKLLYELRNRQRELVREYCDLRIKQDLENGVKPKSGDYKYDYWDELEILLRKDEPVGPVL
ncbi:MAG: hypothetical protein WCW47_01540 [Candidatus Paceibacterota bacterium]|jgi:hypothetical protein